MEMLVDDKGIARALKIPKSTVHYYVRKQAMPCILVGKHKRFNLGKVIKWFEDKSK